MENLRLFPLCISISVLMLISFHAVNCDCSIGGSIVQISRSSKTSDVRMLKAVLLLSQNHREPEGNKQIKVDAWFDMKEDYEMFLLIDEVYDADARMNFPLKNPYMIQVSTGEQSLFYPLLMNDVVNVTCNEGEMVQRRDADNDEALTDEGSEERKTFEMNNFNQKIMFNNSGDRMNPEDLLNSVREGEDEAITKDFPGFTSGNGPNGTNEKDLFYGPGTGTPSAGRKISTLLAIMKTQFQAKPNRNFGESMQNKMTTYSLSKAPRFPSKGNYPIDDDGLSQSGGSPERVSMKISNSNSATNPNRFTNAETPHHKNHHHPLIPVHHVPNHHQNRFYINQNRNEDVKLDGEILIENVTLAGLINDPDARKLNAPHKSSIKMKNHQNFEDLTSADNYEYKRKNNGIPLNYNPVRADSDAHLNFNYDINTLQKLNEKLLPLHQKAQTKSTGT